MRAEWHKPRYVKLELISVVDAERRNWLSKAKEEIERLKNFVVLCQGGRESLRPLLELVGSPYEPEHLEKWGVYALNDVLEKADLQSSIAQVQRGVSAFLFEQIKLPITRPPRVKPILLYCQARGIVSQHDGVKEAKADLVKMVELYNRAHMFPLAGVYRWEDDHWDHIRSLF
jgi:hypothetical protein